MSNLTDYFQMNPRAMVNLGTATVAGAAATTLTLSGLDLSAYESFQIKFKVKNATGSSTALSLFYNSDTTETNYYRQNAIVGGTATVTGTRANNANIGGIGANEKTNGVGEIQSDVDGYPRAFVTTNRDDGSGIQLHSYVQQWLTAANVTTITLSSSVASALDVGSTFSVYGIE